MTTTTTATVDSGWRFNKNYDDLAQVAPFLPAFMARLAELQAAGTYRYNDLFKGHIPGIEGPNEDTAIYLLQGLEQQNAQDAKVAALLANGYEHITAVDGITKFRHIVLYPTRRMGGSWEEYRDARIVPRDTAGTPGGVLPWRARTNVDFIGDRAVLAAR